MNRWIVSALRTAAVAAFAFSSMASMAQRPLVLAFNPGSTGLIHNKVMGVTVSPDGQKLQVATHSASPYWGGLLSFGTYPWWVDVANFTTVSKVGTARTGDVYRGIGQLPPPPGQPYTIATLLPGTTNVFQLTPVDMKGRIRGSLGSFVGTMRGTVTTDGRLGELVPTNIIDFDIVVEGTQTP